MPEIITTGETMCAFASGQGLLRYNRNYEMKIAGAESNFAIDVQKLGHDCGWMSKLGEDEFGHFILNSVRSEGVDCSQVHFTEEAQTGLLFKQRAAGNETSVFYYRKGSAASRMRFTDFDGDYLRSAKYIHLTGITPLLGESNRELFDQLFEMAEKEHLQISYDPNIRLKICDTPEKMELLKGYLLRAQLVMLGLDEAKLLLGETTFDGVCDRLFAEGKAEVIAVKDGARGAYVANKEERVKIEPYPCHPVEPVGAGDAFNAGFICGLLEGKPLAVCGKMGAIAGALTTENVGDTEGMPVRTQMQKLLGGESQIYR